MRSPFFAYYQGRDGGHYVVWVFTWYCGVRSFHHLLHCGCGVGIPQGTRDLKHVTHNNDLTYTFKCVHGFVFCCELASNYFVHKLGFCTFLS